jgi:hypothetical protein
MRYPWVNTALYVLLLAQLFTGFLGLANGAEKFEWLLWLHAICGYAIVALLIWKTRIILDVFRRGRRIDFARASFLFLAALLLTILATGITWLIRGDVIILGFSLMTLHALAALALVTLFIWHVWTRWFIVSVPASRDRRAFLRSTATLAAGFFAWRIVEPALSVLQLPGASRRFTGSYPLNYLPEVIWLADSVAPIEASQWRLELRGLVERELSLGYDELVRDATDIATETIDCTGGWYSTQEWRGVNLGRLMDRAHLALDARSVVVESVSGYARRFNVAEASGFLIALFTAGAPLTHGHGAPVRLIAPNHRGFEWVKWVAQIRVENVPEIFQFPVPLQ